MRGFIVRQNLRKALGYDSQQKVARQQVLVC